jgi:hypothetical protein
MPQVVWFESVGRGDVALVGGTNASLGDMIAHLARRVCEFRRGSRRLLKPVGSSSRQSLGETYFDCAG